MVLPISEIGKEIVRAPSAQAVVGGAVVAAVAGPLGWSWLCLAALVVSAAAEPFLHHNQLLAINALRRVSIGLTVRVTLRLLAALALVAQGGLSWPQVLVVGLSAFLFVGGRAFYVLISTRLAGLRRSVVETRNIPLGGLDVPPAPPVWLTAWSGSAVSGTEMLVTVPACLAVGWSGVLGYVAPAGVLAVFAAGVWCGLLVRRSRAALAPARVVAAVQRQLEALAPEVLLYFGDNQNAVYQVNMWLETMERLPQRCVILLRNRASLAALGPTGTPVLCVPSAETLMALDFSFVKAALYVANIGNNIHMLRVPGIRSAFIGHGDSDKTASFNPFSRVYDQVWVAGPAGRRRYRDADVGVADSSVVEVGRPQLDEVSGAVRREGSLPTVLYAPTWEGWGDDAQSYSSVATHGVALAEAVLAEGSGVRLVYRPHPFLGRRDPRVAAAHRRIVELIDQANRRDGRGAVPQLQLRIEDPLTAIVDPLARSVASGQAPGSVTALAVAELRAAAEADYWAALGPEAHVVVPENGPSLLSSFAQADVLVTDVSSVLSDFVSTGRPYVVCNVTASSAASFLELAPSARAGTVLDRSGDPGLVVRIARGDVPDEHAEARRRMRFELLGPDSIPSQERFERAVRALAGEDLPATGDGSPPSPGAESLVHG